MDTRPIGMFDSGVGGLTVLKEVLEECVGEKVIYLGDTKSFPYGNKTKESIINLCKNAINFLIKKEVKAIIIACGTATSQALEEMQKCYNIPIIGIIDSTVEYIKNKGYENIGVMATRGTIRSNGWKNKIDKKIKNANVINRECPLLAPMAEEGWTENEIAKLVVAEYLKGLKNIQCLILGCTHYPLFKKVIEEQIGDSVDVINTGEVLARSLNKILKEKNITNNKQITKEYEIYLTDMETNFINVASKLLKDDSIGDRIKLAEY